MNENSQGELFNIPRATTRDFLISESGAPATFVITCGRQKMSEPSAARTLYTSRRFQAAREIAENLKSQYFVVSARYGLLEPNATVAPYDIDIADMPEQEINAWAHEVYLALMKKTNSNYVCILGPSRYSKPVVKVAASQASAHILAPLESIEERYHLDWHLQALAMSKRIHDLGQLYDLIEEERRRGQVFLLKDLSRQKLPARGVYVFLDPNERNYKNEKSRIVRIGTHGISKGSRSTLKSRLANHLGLMDGSGNHRGSIFRLHIGRALLERGGGADRHRSWGVGHHAPPEVRVHERELEQRVSAYIGNLEVFIINVDDEPGKDSLRATIERQLIALCSENLEPVDRPEAAWVGLSSPLSLIRSSGLWNLRGVGDRYDSLAAGSVPEILLRVGERQNGKS